MKHQTVATVGAALGVAVLARAIVRRATAYDLRGKVVLITGGSRGLGLVLARELVCRGARVAICARDIVELERARVELATRGEVCTAVCDVTDPAQVTRLVADVRAHFGAIDVLINNAGVMQVAPMELMNDADFARAMNTHFWAPLRFVQAVLPEMLERGTGRIVNITSIGGKVAVPHMLPYSASKFALVGLSQGLRAELAKHGVLVTTVAPGLMRTGSALRAGFKGHHRDEFAWFALSGSLHVTSMRAERAAHRIIAALRHGDPEVVLSVQAKALAKVAALAPSFVQRALAVVDRLLPRPGGIGRAAASGFDSSSPSRPMRTLRRAAVRNNEL